MAGWKTSKIDSVPEDSRQRIIEATKKVKDAERDVDRARAAAIKVYRDEHRKGAKVSIQMIARIAGVSRAYVHRVVNADRLPRQRVKEPERDGSKTSRGASKAK